MKTPLSQDHSKTATQKSFRNRLVIATKRIAYQELIHPDNKMSQRRACTLIRVPRVTLRRWQTHRPICVYDLNAAEHDFFESPVGTVCLQRIILAAAKTIRYGSSGIRGIQEFLKLSQLDQWVASSTGALHAWVSKVEAQIIEFGHQQQTVASKGMAKKKISICQDENFHEGVPCLVAIEPMSNFILVEKIVEDRTTEAWKQAVNEGLMGLNIEIIQSTSDEGTAILSHVKHELKAEHSPDLFHVQQELTKATAFPLKAQEKEFEKAMKVEEKKLQKMIAKHGHGSTQAEAAKGTYNLRKMGLSERKRRREEVSEAKRALGECYHPINLTTGALQSVEEIEANLTTHVGIVEQRCLEAELSESSLKRLQKVRGMIGSMVTYLRFFFMILQRALDALGMGEGELAVFREVLIPVAYIEGIIKKHPVGKRAKLVNLLEELKRRARAGPWAEETLEIRMAQAREMAAMFQRSSSCVEGRNGVLALKHHSFHVITERTLKALTVIHNYHVRRDDGSTAAERFFGMKHENLFGYLLNHVPMLGRPRTRRNQKVAHEVAA